MSQTKKSRSTAKIIKAAEDIVIADGGIIMSASKSHLSHFFDFVREQGIVGLAVGLAIGTAAGAAVKAIVDGLINPIVGFIIGGVDLVQLKWVVVAPNAAGRGGLVFSWGAVISALITLLATALVIYWLIRVAKLNRIDKKKDE